MREVLFWWLVAGCLTSTFSLRMAQVQRLPTLHFIGIVLFIIVCWPVIYYWFIVGLVDAHRKSKRNRRQ